MTRKIILASASPRRRELLAQAALDFSVCPSDVEENFTDKEPERVVVNLASVKALDVAAKQLKFDDDRIVLGADTIVVCDKQILGKPKDDEDAKRILRILSGHTHYVYTGVCFVENRGGALISHTFFEKTDVTMYDMTEDQISWYVSTREPSDKAGAYGIQGIGGVFVSSICGDYNNVVGLPLARVWHYLSRSC